MIAKRIASYLLMIQCGFSFAASLGKVAIADPVLGNRTLVYEKVDDYAVVEGDIIIGRLEEINGPSAVFRPQIGGSPWREGIIPFEISDDLPLINKLAVLQAISHWQKYTSLKFIEINSKNHEEFRDYLIFIPAPGTSCSSYVGRQGGRQEINLSPRCTSMNTVHEIGHAVGLWHEQSRADRDNYIRILWDNIANEHRFNFDQHLTDGRDYGDYDYQSIMHYGPYAFSKNGEKTLVPLDESIEIGQRNQLSEKDIAAVAAMYPGTLPGR